MAPPDAPPPDAPPPADPAAPSAAAGPVRAALRRVLRPLARLMIRRGLTLPAATELLKEVLVEVAETEFALDDRPPTDSRVSLLTGVHRKDVRALRGRAPPPARARALAATVLGRWLGDPAFRGPDGGPRRLARRAEPGEPPGFEDLVGAISRDLRPRTVLDELVNLGLVAIDDHGGLVLVVEAVLPDGQSDAALEFFARNLADHAEAATRNLATPPGAPRFLERAVFYNRLSPARVAALEDLARIRALATLAELNAAALAAQAADADDPAARERFRFGVYFYRAADPPPGAAGEEPE